GVLKADRVQTMVAEGVEFFSSSDHDYLVDYAPTVDALGMEQWVQTAVGNETTTLEIGHFIGFPLGHDYLTESGLPAGAQQQVDWTGKDPSQILGSLRMMGETVGLHPFVFVAHPRDGIIGYFDQWGFDPFSGSPGTDGLPGQANITTSVLSLANPQL